MKPIKNIVILVAMLLISASSYCQVGLNSFIETGYEDRSISIYDERYPTAIARFGNMFTSINLSADYKGVVLYSDLKTYIKRYSLIDYQPLQTEYKIGLAYAVNRLEFRYEHLCSHSTEIAYFHEGYDKISVKFHLINK